MTGRVDNIDAQIVVEYRRAFGEDGDAALTLQIVAVHCALGHLLIGAKRARLLEHGIHERGFAVIDVGDNSDIAEIHVRSGLNACVLSINLRYMAS